RADRAAADPAHAEAARWRRRQCRSSRNPLSSRWPPAHASPLQIGGDHLAAPGRATDRAAQTADEAPAPLLPPQIEMIVAGGEDAVAGGQPLAAALDASARLVAHHHQRIG